MMNQSATVLVAAAALLAAISGGAAARGTTRAENPPSQQDSARWMSESGIASYYGPAHQGRISASGLRFDQMALTAAHPWLPFGTKVKVTLVETGRTVVVTITDRLYSNRRIVDLSLAAARRLGMISSGIAKVTLIPA
jgi:peptidoglycan lytic transglycosylase